MNLKKVKYFLAKGLIFLFWGSAALAEPISNQALFYRCYRQITQSFPNPRSNLVAQVKNGSLNPIDACMTVLNKATFNANNGYSIKSPDKEALTVLKNFQNLHYSFFSRRIFDDKTGFWENTKNSIDVNGPALYFTKALFTPNYPFANVFKGNINYESLRTTSSPNIAPSTQKDKSYYLKSMGVDVSPTWQQTGALVGIRPFTKKTFNFMTGGKTKKMNFDNNWGGGVLGSNSYMFLNIRHNRLLSDGAVQMPRKWGQSVYNDFLCRKLPVVRYADAQSFVTNGGGVPFRNDTACTRCHVSMDRISGVVRNSYATEQYPNGADGKWGEMQKLSTTASSAEVFPAAPDNDYYKRPLDGHFYYRTFDGRLINKAVRGAEALGRTIASIDAPYICMAKRYYHYFIGVDANVDDIKDPQYGRTLSSLELKHRNEVLNLGKRFKSHQSLKKLIEEIMRKPQFRDSSYEITN